jgi:hypothetical protein
MADLCAQSHWGSVLGVGDDRVEKAVLGLELVIAGGPRDPRPGGDVIDRCVVKAALDEEIVGGLDDRPPG